MSRSKHTIKDFSLLLRDLLLLRSAWMIYKSGASLNDLKRGADILADIPFNQMRPLLRPKKLIARLLACRVCGTPFREHDNYCAVCGKDVR